MNGLSILGTGRCLPDHIVTNDDLARRVETSNDWIVSRTGIRERRFAQGETLTQLAVAAARRAMERAGVGPQDIGLCLMATVTPDWITPSQACLLHQELGLPEDCPAFDLSAGCTGFLYAMETAAAMLPRMARPCALLVGGELLWMTAPPASSSETERVPQWSKARRGPPGTPCWAPGVTGRPCGRRARATTRPTST